MWPNAATSSSQPPLGLLLELSQFVNATQRQVNCGCAEAAEIGFWPRLVYGPHGGPNDTKSILALSPSGTGHPPSQPACQTQGAGGNVSWLTSLNKQPMRFAADLVKKPCLDLSLSQANTVSTKSCTPIACAIAILLYCVDAPHKH